MSVQQTSLLAFSEIRGDLPPRQADVADCIDMYGPVNNKEIADKLHLPINSVTPRVLELRQKGIVKLSCTAMSSEGRLVNYWELA